MSDKNLGRRTAVSVKFNNVDITKDITENLISLTYTDAADGETDDLKIVIHDRDRTWVKDWLKKELEQRDEANGAIASGTETEQTTHYTVTAKIGLNVRTGRGTGYRKIGLLQYGKEVDASEIVNDWATIQYSGQTAYVAARYLKKSSGTGTGEQRKSGNMDGRTTSNAKYTKINAVITAQNVDGEGTDRVLDCGTFELDNVRFTAPPAKIEMSATSLEYESTVRKTKKTASYSQTTLADIAKVIADRSGYNLMYVGAYNPNYQYILQNNISDIEFLSQRCQAAGLNLKVTSGNIIIYDSTEMEKNESVRTITWGDGSYEKVSLDSSLSMTAYASCHVSYEDADGNSYEATYTPETAYSEGEVLEVTEQVGSDAEAMELAMRRLRKENKGEITGQIQMLGDPRLVAGANIELNGFGDFDGKYTIEKAVHKVPTYTTSIEISKVVEGY